MSHGLSAGIPNFQTHTYWTDVELFTESHHAKRCQGTSWFSQCQRRFRAVCVASMLGCSRILLGHVAAHHANSAGNIRKKQTISNHEWELHNWTLGCGTKILTYIRNMYTYMKCYTAWNYIDLYSIYDYIIYIRDSKSHKISQIATISEDGRSWLGLTLWEYPIPGNVGPMVMVQLLEVSWFVFARY